MEVHSLPPPSKTELITKRIQVTLLIGFATPVHIIFNGLSLNYLVLKF